MPAEKVLCEFCGKPVSQAERGSAIPVKRCQACCERLAAIDSDIRKLLGDKWRLEAGLRFARWAVLDIPPGPKFVWKDLDDMLDIFGEEPFQSFEITVCGKRQIILFFFDTFHA